MATGRNGRALEQLVASLGLSGRVFFVGHVPDPSPLYRAFDLFALTSDTEQMPMTILEAMAAALPVAATDVGDIKEMLAPENRDFIVPRDDRALADAFLALLRQPELRRSVGAANRARAERDYDQEVMFRCVCGAVRWPQHSLLRPPRPWRRAEQIPEIGGRFRTVTDRLRNKPKPSPRRADVQLRPICV